MSEQLLYFCFFLNFYKSLNLFLRLGGAGLPGGTPEEEIGTTGNNNSRADDNKGGSRFSKFFGAPGSKPRSRKSSIQVNKLSREG